MEIKDRILEFLQYHPGISRPQIMEGMSIELGDAQMKRILADCVASGTVRTEGRARATRYFITPKAHLRSSPCQTSKGKDTNMNKLLITGCLLATAFAAVAKPTKKELAAAQKLVEDVIAPDLKALNAGRKTVKDVADIQMKLAADAVVSVPQSLANL